jgi:hypothetical protein
MLTGYLDSTAREVRYLLGELSEDEAKRFEELCFTDDRIFEELLVAEGEVIDAYVNESLPAPGRRHLEKRLNKSQRLRDRLAFARTFAGAVPDIQLEELPVAPAELPSRNASPPIASLAWWRRLFTDSPERRPTWTMALAACVIFVLLGGAIVIVQSVRLSRESQRLVAERTAIERERETLARISAEQNTRLEASASEFEAQQRRLAEARAQLEELQQRASQMERDRGDQPKAGTPTMAALILYAGSVRSGEGPAEVKITPGTSQLSLGLVLETADYRSYDVVIKDAQKKEAFSRKGMRLRLGKTLSLIVPTTQLKPGTYDVAVRGVASSGATEHLRTYQFRVISE